MVFDSGGGELEQRDRVQIGDLDQATLLVKRLVVLEPPHADRLIAGCSEAAYWREMWIRWRNIGSRKLLKEIDKTFGTN